jgi:hypothetical protein
MQDSTEPIVVQDEAHSAIAKWSENKKFCVSDLAERMRIRSKKRQVVHVAVYSRQFSSEEESPVRVIPLRKNHYGHLSGHEFIRHEKRSTSCSRCGGSGQITEDVPTGYVSENVEISPASWETYGQGVRWRPAETTQVSRATFRRETSTCGSCGGSGNGPKRKVAVYRRFKSIVDVLPLNDCELPVAELKEAKGEILWRTSLPDSSGLWLNDSSAVAELTESEKKAFESRALKFFGRFQRGAVRRFFFGDTDRAQYAILSIPILSIDYHYPGRQLKRLVVFGLDDSVYAPSYPKDRVKLSVLFVMCLVLSAAVWHAGKPHFDDYMAKRAESARIQEERQRLALQEEARLQAELRKERLLAEQRIKRLRPWVECVRFAVAQIGNFELQSSSAQIVGVENLSKRYPNWQTDLTSPEGIEALLEYVRTSGDRAGAMLLACRLKSRFENYSELDALCLECLNLKGFESYEQEEQLLFHNTQVAACLWIACRGYFSTDAREAMMNLHADAVSRGDLRLALHIFDVMYRRYSFFRDDFTFFSDFSEDVQTAFPRLDRNDLRTQVYVLSYHHYLKMAYDSSRGKYGSRNVDRQFAPFEREYFKLQESDWPAIRKFFDEALALLRDFNALRTEESY